MLWYEKPLSVWRGDARSGAHDKCRGAASTEMNTEDNGIELCFRKGNPTSLKERKQPLPERRHTQQIIVLEISPRTIEQQRACGHEASKRNNPTRSFNSGNEDP